MNLNHALFYDTETTGLPDWKNPSDGEQQPHIVQLGACLVDLDTKAVIEFMDVIVRPDGWVIPDDVAEVHGITTEHATAEGIPEHEALELFLGMWRQSNQRIGHNESFDARIIRIATKRFSEADIVDAWKEGKVNAQCTARLSCPIVALPPTENMKRARRFHHKTPNLSEAYVFFTGEELQNAHSAMADVRACMAVYFGCIDHNSHEEATND